MPTIIQGVYATDAGMVCLWDPQAFTMINSQETFEKELCEDADILRHIDAGHLVPINTDRGRDGAFDIIVRVGDTRSETALTEREKRYILAESMPYQFNCTGRICLSGIECVERQPGHSVGCIPAAEGRYATKLYFIAWDDELDMKDENGRPKPGSLPDFILLVNPAPKGEIAFRKKVHALEPRRKASAH
jgi:hypothetical protein